MVNEQGAGWCVGNDTCIAQIYLAQVVIVADTCYDNIGIPDRRFYRRAVFSGEMPAPGGRLGPGTIEYGNRIAGRGQVPCHGVTHDTKPYECDCGFHGFPFCIIR